VRPFDDRGTQLHELRIAMRSEGPDGFVTKTEGSVESHRLYLQPEDLRGMFSATGGLAAQRSSDPTTPVRDFGARLYASLFESGLGSLRRIRSEGAQGRNAVLQLRLEVSHEDALLAALPWEWMYDTLRGEFVCLTDEITRSIEGVPPSSDPVASKMILVAMTDGLPFATKEVEAIQRVLGERVAIHVLINPSENELRSALKETKPELLHYIGPSHEDRGGQYIVLGCEKGIERVRADEFTRLLETSFLPAFVTLNACTTSAFPFGLARRVRAVVALNATITDESGFNLGVQLYQRLSGGAPFDAAVAGVRRDLATRSERDLGVPTWAALVLYCSAPAPSLFRERGGLESVAISAPPDPSDSRERRVLELKRQTLERNKQALERRIATYTTAPAPPELTDQLRKIGEDLAKLAAELAR
jgi:hypothetical protein